MECLSPPKIFWINALAVYRHFSLGKDDQFSAVTVNHLQIMELFLQLLLLEVLFYFAWNKTQALLFAESFSLHITSSTVYLCTVI